MSTSSSTEKEHGKNTTDDLRNNVETGMGTVQNVDDDNLLEKIGYQQVGLHTIALTPVQCNADYLS